MSIDNRTEVPAAVGAPEANLSREQVVRRIQQGVLRGRFDRERGWLVERESIVEFRRRRDAEVGAAHRAG
jgi:hypothetical protein